MPNLSGGDAVLVFKGFSTISAIKKLTMNMRQAALAYPAFLPATLR